MDTGFAHERFWRYHLTILDNGQTNIGATIHLYHFLPIDNIIPDNFPSIVTKKPVSVMREPKNLSVVLIKETVPAGFSAVVVLNDCIIIIHDYNPRESGCGGRFCDKQRPNEVIEYKQGCCCYQSSDCRNNIELVHSMTMSHHSLSKCDVYINVLSSSLFSLLYQTSALSSQVSVSSLQITYAFHQLEKCIENVVELINENVGLTVIGW